MMKSLKKSKRINRPKLGNFLPHTHKFVRFVWEEVVNRDLELTSVANAAGVDRSTLHKWKKNTKGPYLVQLEEVLEALGYELMIVEKNKSGLSKSGAVE